MFLYEINQTKPCLGAPKQGAFLLAFLAIWLAPYPLIRIRQIRLTASSLNVIPIALQAFAVWGVRIESE